MKHFLPFKYNPAIQAALKARFGAKFDPKSKQWYVSNKDTAQQAQQLIDDVLAYEDPRRSETGNPGYRIFAETHQGFFSPHPLTGETWQFLNAGLWAKAVGADERTASAEMMAIQKAIAYFLLERFQTARAALAAAFGKTEAEMWE